MPVYKVTETTFEPLDRTDFEREGILERQGIQARLRDSPEVLEDGLYILAEEFSSWDESSRRIDLLALDREGRLVVVELKRSDQDSFMDLQAIRYAAMVAGMTFEQAVDAHRNYLDQRGLDVADAASRIQQQLSGDDTEVAIDSGNPRIILVSANFSKELTTSVLWLNEIGMDVACVKLELYRAGNYLYLEGNRVIPLPEAEEYLIRLTGGQNAAVNPPPPASSKTYQGGEEFRKAAETAQPGSRDLLTRLCEMALSLETEGIASISPGWGHTTPCSGRGSPGATKHCSTCSGMNPDGDTSNSAGVTFRGTPRGPRSNWRESSKRTSAPGAPSGNFRKASWTLYPMPTGKPPAKCLRMTARGRPSSKPQCLRQKWRERIPARMKREPRPGHELPVQTPAGRSAGFLSSAPMDLQPRVPHQAQPDREGILHRSNPDWFFIPGVRRERSYDSTVHHHLHFRVPEVKHAHELGSEVAFSTSNHRLLR